MFHSCMCGGTLRKDFYHPDKIGFVIKIRPYHFRFSIYEHGYNIKNGKNYELKTAMQENDIL